jgi:alpha-L-fucosidase 2
MSARDLRPPSPSAPRLSGRRLPLALEEGGSQILHGYVLTPGGFRLLGVGPVLGRSFLARTTARQKELAIRSALGASRRHVMSQVLLLAAGPLAGPVQAGPVASRPAFDPPPVVWDSPSRDARGSMPLGNGDIALNAWVEPSGDLLFYVGKSDSWEDNARLAKVGLVRLRLEPALLRPGGRFRQELAPARGEMTVTVAPASAPGSGKARTTLRLWVDANHPVIHAAVESTSPVAAAASFELWRTAPAVLPSIEVSDVNLDRSRDDQQHAPTTVEPDTVLRDLPEGVGWLHHKARSVGPVETMRHQDLLEAQRLERAAAKRHRFDVYVLTRHPATPDEWLAATRKEITGVETLDFEARRAAHLEWWRGFWGRSHLVVRPAPGRGAYPIKFNGSLFTVPWPDQPGDAAYRRWGPGYWWQNPRLPYTPLLASGDLDLLQPFHRMYAGDVLAVSRYRAKRYFGFEDAAYFPECVYFWGAVFPEAYGRETTAAERTDKLQESRWHKWEWVGGLELAFMLQDYYDHTGDERFLRETLLLAALPLVRFFDRFYPPGPDGHLLMHPSQALETWWECTNPMPEIAGLHAVVGRLLAPAERFADKRNVENPELYAVFPFRLVSFEKENVALGVEALRRREDRGTSGWRQDDVFMAYLGLAEEAREAVVARARKTDPDSFSTQVVAAIRKTKSL